MTDRPAGRAPRAALFDLDGTLVDSEPRSRQAWARLFAAHGVPLDDGALFGFAGRPGLEVLAEHQHAFPGHTVAELRAESVEYWREAEAGPEVPGAGRFVRAVAESGSPTAVVSSGPRHSVEGELVRLGMREYVDVVVAAEDVHRGKPDPEGYRSACARLGVRPQDAVAFEDSPIGLAAALAAGCRCVAVTTTVGAHRLAGADLVVADLTAVAWPCFG